MQLFYILLYPHYWCISTDDTPGRLIFIITDSKVDALERLTYEVIQGGPPEKQRGYDIYTAGEILTCQLGETVDDDNVVFRRDPICGLSFYANDLINCMRAVDAVRLQNSIIALENSNRR